MHLRYTMAIAVCLMSATPVRAGEVSPIAAAALLAASGITTRPLVSRAIVPNGGERRMHCADWGAQRPYVSFRSESRRCRSRPGGQDG